MPQTENTEIEKSEEIKEASGCVFCREPLWLWRLIFVFLVLFSFPAVRAFVSDVALFARDTLLYDNFHALIPDRVYRSGQMSHPRLEETIKSLGIRTVIDLRAGDAKPQADGRVEGEVVESNGAAYIHVPLVTTRVPTKERILDLLKAFDGAEEPLLMHCSSGQHRTGMASALWLIYQEGKSTSEAWRQLSPRYGFFMLEYHYRLWENEHPPLPQLLMDYEAARELPFKDWVEQGGDELDHKGKARFVSAESSLPER